MKLHLIILILLFSSSSFARIGRNKDFCLLSISEYITALDEGHNVMIPRCVVISDINPLYKTLSLDDADEELFYKVAYMLKKNKKKQIKDLFPITHDEREIFSLLNGLYYFSQKEYRFALMALEAYDGYAFQFLKYLLIADCDSELSMAGVNYSTLLNDFQLALDKAATEVEKGIIRNRIKYIRYTR